MLEVQFLKNNIKKGGQYSTERNFYIVLDIKTLDKIRRFKKENPKFKKYKYRY